MNTITLITDKRKKSLVSLALGSLIATSLTGTAEAGWSPRSWGAVCAKTCTLDAVEKVRKDADKVNKVKKCAKTCDNTKIAEMLIAHIHGLTPENQAELNKELEYKLENKQAEKKTVEAARRSEERKPIRDRKKSALGKPALNDLIKKDDALAAEIKTIEGYIAQFKDALLAGSPQTPPPVSEEGLKASVSDAFKFMRLPETATWADVQKEYNMMAKKSHPDKGGNNDTFNKLNEARKVLEEYFKNPAAKAAPKAPSPMLLLEYKEEVANAEAAVAAAKTAPKAPGKMAAAKAALEGAKKKVTGLAAEAKGKLENAFNAIKGKLQKALTTSKAKLEQAQAKAAAAEQNLDKANADLTKAVQEQQTTTGAEQALKTAEQAAIAAAQGVANAAEELIAAADAAVAATKTPQEQADLADVKKGAEEVQAAAQATETVTELRSKLVEASAASGASPVSGTPGASAVPVAPVPLAPTAPVAPPIPGSSTTPGGRVDPLAAARSKIAENAAKKQAGLAAPTSSNPASAPAAGGSNSLSGADILAQGKKLRTVESRKKDDASTGSKSETIDFRANLRKVPKIDKEAGQ